MEKLLTQETIEAYTKRFKSMMDLKLSEKRLILGGLHSTQQKGSFLESS